MSKVIKSKDCVEAHPCRLDPIDVDAFFVNNPPSVPEQTAEQTEEQFGEEEFAEGQPELPLETAREEIATASDIEPVENGSDGSQGLAVEEKTNTMAEETPEDALARLLKGLTKENSETSKNFTDEIATALDTARGEAINSFQESLELITKSQAEADEIVGTAKLEADRHLEQARQEAETLLREATGQAETILAEAKQQASDVIAKAKQEAEQIKAEAKEEGFVTGQEQGLLNVRQELDQNLKTALELIGQAEAERVSRIRSSEEELLKLSLEIAEKIIAAELKTDRTQMLMIIREALSKAAISPSFNIKVNPEDYSLVQENLPQLQQIFSEPKAINLIEDQGISPGNCFIETEHGNIDPRIRTQLQAIADEIIKAGRIE